MIIDQHGYDQQCFDPHVLADHYKSLSWRISPKVYDHALATALPGPMVFLFSGSWRFRLAARFVELRSYRTSALDWHPNTIFLEPNDADVYEYSLKKMRAQSFLILHSDYWTGFRPVQQVIEDLEYLSKYCHRAICTMPMRTCNFNKLKLSAQDIAAQYQGQIVDDSFVFVRDKP